MEFRKDKEEGERRGRVEAGGRKIGGRKEELGGEEERRVKG